MIRKMKKRADAMTQAEATGALSVNYPVMFLCAVHLCVYPPATEQLCNLHFSGPQPSDVFCGFAAVKTALGGPSDD